MQTKKWCAVLLSAVLLLSLWGTAAFAEGADIEIASETDWEAFCTALAGGETYAGQTVALIADISTDQMAGSASRSSAEVTGNAFKGTFDGGGHTITFTYETTGAAAAQPGVGIFSVLDGAVVQNLKADVRITDVYGEYAVGGIAGYMINGAVVDQCQVTGQISAVNDAGGIVGKGIAAAKITNSGNAAEISTQAGKTGGIASSMYYPPAEEGALLIENCTNSGNITASAGGYSGGIVGLGTGAQVFNCTNSGTVTGAATSVGGIVGELEYCGIVADCENTGDVIKNGNGYGAGGVVGWIRYPQSSAYASVGKATAVVKNSVNKGNVTSDGGYTGGVIGVVYNAAALTDCANYGTITAGSMSGMVVGNYQKTEIPIDGVTNHVTVTGCINYAREANLSGSSVGILFGHVPEDPAQNPADYTIEENQSVVVLNTAAGENLPAGNAAVDYVETATVGNIRFVPEQNVVSVYLDAAENGQIIENFVAAELTVAVTGDFSIGSFAPISDDLVIDDRGGGCYLIREKEGEDGLTDLTGSSIPLGTITLNGIGEGTIGLQTGAPAQMQRRTADNIVVTSALTFTEAQLQIEQTKHTLTVQIDFNNNLAEGNTADYQDMQIVISGADGTETVYAIGSGTAADEHYVAYTADGASVSVTLPENIRYTVEVRGAGYRSAKKTVTLTEDVTVRFWNNVKDAAEDNGEIKNFLAGEIVKDGKINLYDLSAVVSYFGEVDLNQDGTKSDYTKYDLNRDGKVDSKDVAMVLISWGE